MQTSCSRSRSRAGILLTVMILMLAAAMVCASSISAALMNLRIAHRQDMRSEMTIVGDAELEWLFFNVKMAVMSGTLSNQLSSSLRLSGLADFSDTPTTVRETYLDEHLAKGWRVRRSVRHLLQTRGIDSSNGGTRRSLLDFIEAKVVIMAPANGSYSNIREIKVGRYFVVSQATIFQYGVFFEGDLELNPGEIYTLDGDIYSSGNAFLGPILGKALTIKAQAVMRLTPGKKLNGSDNPEVAGLDRYNPDAPPTSATLQDPLFELSGSGAPGEQLEQLKAEENLLGGLDALATAQTRPDLFGPDGNEEPDTWTEAEEKQAINNVRRSLIVPPPSKASADEYPNSPTGADDPAISVQRAYNRAGLVVTVEENGTVSVEQVSASTGTRSDVTSEMMQTNTAGGPIASSAPQNVYDAREGRNVKVTEVDVAELKKKVGNDFNGLLYVNLKNSTSTAPAAVRIVNGEDIPVTSSGAGLSIATNGGLYLKGSFNTVSSGTKDGKSVYPSSMLMADGITVLSYNWNDANANLPVETQRVAGVDNPNTTEVENKVEINAGLLTGNVATTSVRSSGGAQNLIRYLENWSGKDVNYLGSLGRLFDSKIMSRPFLGPSTVYRAPNRTVRYDPELSSAPPAGSPILTQFSRGDFFIF